MMRVLIFAPLVLCASARLARSDFGSPLDAKPADPPEVNYALQDLQEAMTIKGQFNTFLDRVNGDTDKLHAALESQGTKIGDLELEKQSLQNQMQTEKARLSHELEVFKQKMIAKITDLKTNNRRLEETNMQLVSSNDKLNAELEAEKGKKELLVKKLKKMAQMFAKQQQSVQTIIQQNSQRLESEVSSDVNEALYNAGDVEQGASVTASTYTAPARAPPAPAAMSEDEEDAMKLPAGLEDDDDEEQKPAPKPQAVVAPKPKAVPHGGEIKKAVSAAANSAAAHAREAVEEAARHAKAAAAAKVQAERKPAPTPAAPASPKPATPVAKPAPKVSSSTAEDDAQLKALRAEVERLESSVKTDDSEAPSAASLVHVKKNLKTSKVASKEKDLEAASSDSVKTLQDVGGMLSEAMAAGDDDN